MQGSQQSELAHTNLGAAAPKVITGQIDVLPTQWKQILQQGVVDAVAVTAQRMRGALQIDRIGYFPTKVTQLSQGLV